MGKLIVHIGLPKTATTTLQAEVFPRYPGITYLGVEQPRGPDVDPLYSEVCRVVNRGAEGESARAEVRRRIDDGETLLISEEMFLVGNSAVGWEEKMRNLSRLVNGLAYEILVTVREPIAGMFSFYVERYERYADTGSSFLELASNHIDFKVYYYDYLFAVLSANFDIARVRAFPFESIIEGDLNGLDAVLGRPPAKFEGSITALGDHNRRLIADGEVVVEKKFSVRWMDDVYRRLGGSGNPFLMPFAYLLRRPRAWLLKRNVRPQRIPRPDSVEKALLLKKAESGINVLADLYGIDYSDKSDLVHRSP